MTSRCWHCWCGQPPSSVARCLLLDFVASDQRALPDPTAVALWRHGLQREEALLGSEAMKSDTLNPPQPLDPVESLHEHWTTRSATVSRATPAELRVADRLYRQSLLQRHTHRGSKRWFETQLRRVLHSRNPYFYSAWVEYFVQRSRLADHRACSSEVLLTATQHHTSSPLPKDSASAFAHAPWQVAEAFFMNGYAACFGAAHVVPLPHIPWAQADYLGDADQFCDHCFVNAPFWYPIGSCCGHGDWLFCPSEGRLFPTPEPVDQAECWRCGRCHSLPFGFEGDNVSSSSDEEDELDFHADNYFRHFCNVSTSDEEDELEYYACRRVPLLCCGCGSDSEICSEAGGSESEPSCFRSFYPERYVDPCDDCSGCRRCI